MVPLKPNRRDVSVILGRGDDVKRTHDFHIGDAFAHRFDLRAQAW